MNPENKQKLNPFLNKLSTLLFYFCLFVFIVALAFPHNPAGNWYQQFMPNIGGRSILDITFLDSLTGYSITTISADTSYILKTTDSGDSWSINHRAASSIFRRIQFINNDTGYVGGQHLIKTTNGGSNWFLVYPSLFAEDIYFINSDTAWYADPNSLVGGVFFTSNGGVNWQQQINLGNQNPEKVYMFNSRIGYISKNLGSQGYVRKTTNSGVSWNLIISNDYFFKINFVDSLTGWKNSAFGFKKTTNGGLNWELQTIPFGGIIQSGFIYDFTVLNRDTLWGTGGYVLYPNNEIRGIIYRTINGGINWEFQIPDTAIKIGGYNFIRFTDRLYGWLYRDSPTGIHTVNGGDTQWLTGIKQISAEIPSDYELFQNYPNPFNPKTNIKYQIKKGKHISLIVYDITGKQVIDLVNRSQAAGIYEVDFSAYGISTGIYLYSLFADGVVMKTKKMILTK